MANNTDLLDLAIKYHEELPARIRQYLNDRGIPDAIINSHLLGWNGLRITIPIYDRKGEVVYFKLAKDPEDENPGPKMLASPGTTVELYGWDRVIAQTSPLVICEGEFDRLVLEANGFAAVTSTGGAGTFRSDWAIELEPVKEVYVCFDRDPAGRRGAIRVALMIPHAKLVELPEEVGLGGDVTDFFVALKRSREDFLQLLERAQPVPPELRIENFRSLPTTPSSDSATSQRTERIKREVPIAQVVAHYVHLRVSGQNLVGICPFQEDHIPSLAVYPSTGRFHCYGCQKHGDVISFMREIENLSFGQALDVLEQIKSDYGFEPE
jgi:DNA primase